MLCLTLPDPMDYSLPGSSIHGILQARVLEWVAISFFRGSSQPKERAWVSCTAGRLYHLSHQGSPVSHRDSVISQVCSSNTVLANRFSVAYKNKNLFFLLMVRLQWRVGVGRGLSVKL